MQTEGPNNEFVGGLQDGDHLLDGRDLLVLVQRAQLSHALRAQLQDPGVSAGKRGERGGRSVRREGRAAGGGRRTHAQRTSRLPVSLIWLLLLRQLTIGGERKAVVTTLPAVAMQIWTSGQTKSSLVTARQRLDAKQGAQG